MRFGIAAQLVVPFIAVSSVIVCLLGFGLLSTVSHILNASLDEKSRCLARTTASELRAPLLLGEDIHAQTILDMAMKSDRDLSYVVVCGDDGAVLCSKTAPGAVPLPFDETEKKTAGSIAGEWRRSGNAGGAFELVAPIEISDERAGILRMGFTNARIEQQMEATQYWIIAAGTLSLVLGSAAYVVLISLSILQPIKTVVATSARIADGDVGETVNVKRRDEIGELLNAMNKMVLYLRDMSNTADAIANGDLSVNVAPRSSVDRFGNAFRKMVESLNKATSELVAREAEARKLAAIVQYSHDAIISVNPDGKVSSWNAGAQSLLGYQAADVIGKPIEALFDSAAADFEINALFGARLFANASVLETNLTKQSGGSVEVSMTISPVIGKDGGVSSYSVIARDVSHKRLVERRLREFYSMVSHELRTPLTSIRGGLALIAQGVVPADSDDGMRLIQLAQSSCMRLIRLINHILDIRKIEDGNIQLDLQETKPSDLIKLSVEEMDAFAYERGVRLKIGHVADATIKVDVDRMVQVLTNLISNAVKYSKSGQEVNISAGFAASGQLRFAVSDQGDGIAPDSQSKLFCQFQQVDSSDSRAKEGSGLGLFISKAIVEQHGGQIGVVSELAKGSTFWFEIPCAVPDSANALCISREDNPACNK